MFNIEFLRTFVTVAELRSFTRASAQLHLTQSTISQHIKRLEEAIGQSLFQRTTRSIELTDAGNLFLSYARQIVFLEQEARETLNATKHDFTLRLGAPDDVAKGFMMQALAHLKQTYPYVRLELTVELSNKLRAMHEQGEIDLIVVKQKPGQGGTPIRPEPLVWIDSAGHPSVNETPLPLVVFPANGLYRNEIFRYLENAGLPWRIRLSCSNLSAIQSAVASGIGVSLIPRSAVWKTHRILTETQGFSSIPAMELTLYGPAKVDKETRFLISSLMEAALNPQGFPGKSDNNVA